jgi:hypothetical protein
VPLWAFVVEPGIAGIPLASPVFNIPGIPIQRGLVPWMFGILFVLLTAYAFLAPADKKPDAKQNEVPSVHAMPSKTP